VIKEWTVARYVGGEFRKVMPPSAMRSSTAGILLVITVGNNEKKRDKYEE
jgi:hypothetical protein